MNFFEHQEQARRNTRVMVLLFALAVLAVALAVDVVLAAIYVWGYSEFYIPYIPDSPGGWSMIGEVPPQLYLWGALGTLALILLVSLYHMTRLSEGGPAVARLVGARRVSPDTIDLRERRLLNVVEEMAIAAGTRVPQVYVMDDEAGLNAFAAGYNGSNSVITVTRGALETLSRDELQGVVGHEFSHIINGDMRLNIRMMGVLGGIVFIGAIGEFLMRLAGRSSGRRDNKGTGGLLALGLALFAIGYVGLFFARLIKAAVSREREFLADAASVQFTRNPAGIAGALDQMRASSAGTLITHRYAEDMSHLFFGQGVSVWAANLFATHPPLDERIRRVMPAFRPAEYRTRRAPESDAQAAEAAAAAVNQGQRAGDAAHAWGRSLAQSVALVGMLDAGNVDYARRLLDWLPAALNEAIHRQDGAAAALIALMLAGPQSVRDQQLAAVRAAGAAALVEPSLGLTQETAGLGPQYRLALVDLALASLKSASKQAQQELLTALEAVIHADRRVSLHEFVVLTLVRSQLSPEAGPAVAELRSISQLRSEVLFLLSLVAEAGRGFGDDAQNAAQAAFAKGTAELGLTEAAPFRREELTMQAADAALKQLKALAPLAKAELVRALFATIIADNTISVSEAELLRLVGAALDCPVPPLVQALGPAAASLAPAASVGGTG